MRILIAVSGGIACYKSAELVRLLIKQGYEVRVVMTPAATHFVSPLTFQALSGHAVSTELFDLASEQAMGHIHLGRWADALVIAPATANVIAKCRYGLADDLVSTLYLAATCPVYMAPAMNQAMWHKKITQDNINALSEQGVVIIGPEQGGQACGEVGFGRMSEPFDIYNIVFNNLHANVVRPLLGKDVLISAGPTREALDPVRYITNRSSGKMGFALADAALKAGAKVTLVSGPVHLPTPSGAELIPVDSAEHMCEAVLQRAQQYDIYIGAAAVADYSPVASSLQKIKKQDDELIIRLKKNRDILAEMAKLPKRPFTVGFAAETDNLEHYALDKLAKKKLDIIAANWVGKEQGGFEHDENELHIFWPTGQTVLAMANKQQIARQLIDLIAMRLHEKNTA